MTLNNMHSPNAHPLKHSIGSFEMSPSPHSQQQICPVKPIFKSEGDTSTTRHASRTPSSDINQTWLKSAFLFLQGLNILQIIYYYTLHLDQSWQPTSYQSKPPTTSSSVSSWPRFDFFILCKNILRLCANN